jgi:transposase
MRVVALVESGESAREAARQLEVGASSAIRWAEQWSRTGSVAAKPGTGHCRSPLEVHRQWLLDLVAGEPDLTLEEIRARLAVRKKLKIGTCACRKLNPGILVMQSAQGWATKNVPGAIDGARDRCIFLQG